jgi:membrane-bound lytic murein transglycosylase A
MKNKIAYILGASTLCLLGSLLIWKYYPKHEIRMRTADFAQLPGWKNMDAKESFLAFQISCKAFLKQDPEASVGSKHIHLHAKDWYPSCKAALSTSAESNNDVKDFFEHWFTPVAFHNGKPVQGLFTGYYMPMLKGSLTRTEKYKIPLYGVPNDLITLDLGIFDPELKYHRKIVGRVANNKLVPYYTRAQISKGAIKKHAPVIAWIDSVVDRQFLEIEGSGVVELDDGKKLYVGYDGENGAAYTPIARVLIQQGVMTRDNASMQRIRAYFKSHPDQISKVLNQNKSFVFFKMLPIEAALGSQGVALTPGYSLAVDRTWVPMGTPIWLNTTQPAKNSQHKPFQRLMIAQDTGGAIRGAVRGDVFWGAGEEATFAAGHMKNQGYYWLLLPKQAAVSLEDKSTA